MYHGSYRAEDVDVLMDPIPVSELMRGMHLPLVGSNDWRALVESERAPSAEYMDFVRRALEANKQQLARDVIAVARRLAAVPGDEPLALVSLIRAGTAAGVLLQRTLAMLGRNSRHYSISAVRGNRCQNALRHILTRHAEDKLFFVDGWTGKGTVAQQVCDLVLPFNAEHGANIDPQLVVLSDLAGVAGISAGANDYLMPTAMLRAVGTGLFSPAIINDEQHGLGEFDVCLHYDNVQAADFSLGMADIVTAEIARLLPDVLDATTWGEHDRAALRETSLRFVDFCTGRWNIPVTQVKPGICEAGRWMLTPNPRMVLMVRNPGDAEVEHLIALAFKKGSNLRVDPLLPYRAAVAILEQ